MGNRWNLTSVEVNALIELLMYHWRPEDRVRVAGALPAAYAKLTGCTTEVRIIGGMTIQHGGGDK